jgi:hypothetical protein
MAVRLHTSHDADLPLPAKLIRGDWFKEIYEWDPHDQVERYLAEH